jgi:hypothetical protein
MASRQLINTVQLTLFERGIGFSKATYSVNQRWTNLILNGIKGDTGMQPWEVQVNKKLKLPQYTP